MTQYKYVTLARIPVDERVVILRGKKTGTIEGVRERDDGDDYEHVEWQCEEVLDLPEPMSPSELDDYLQGDLDDLPPEHPRIQGLELEHTLYGDLADRDDGSRPEPVPDDLPVRYETDGDQREGEIAFQAPGLDIVAIDRTLDNGGTTRDIVSYEALAGVEYEDDGDCIAVDVNELTGVEEFDAVIVNGEEVTADGE